MSSRRNTIVLAVAAAAALAASGGHIYAQGPAPTNDAPNPYNTVKDFFKLPAGRVWGSTSAVDIDKDGKSIWVAERCGTNSCFDRATNTMSQLPTVLKFDRERHAGAEFRRRHADLSARHLGRSRRQRLGD